LWRKKAKKKLLSTAFSENLYFGEGKNSPPYLGGMVFRLLEQVSEFSTIEVVYPQYSASYPQYRSTALQYFGNLSPIYRFV